MKKTQSSLTYWIGVVITGLTLGLILQFAQAWTEPTTEPPGGNVGAPLNTGGIDQTKQGGLIINGQGNVGFGMGIDVKGSTTNDGLGFALRATGKQAGVEGGSSTLALLGYYPLGAYIEGPGGSTSVSLGRGDGYAAWFAGNTQHWGFIHATDDICTSKNNVWKCLSETSAGYNCECFTEFVCDYIGFNGGHRMQGWINCGGGWESLGKIYGSFKENGSCVGTGDTRGWSGFYKCRR